MINTVKSNTCHLLEIAFILNPAPALSLAVPAEGHEQQFLSVLFQEGHSDTNIQGSYKYIQRKVSNYQLTTDLELDKGLFAVAITTIIKITGPNGRFFSEAGAVSFQFIINLVCLHSLKRGLRPPHHQASFKLNSI